MLTQLPDQVSDSCSISCIRDVQRASISHLQDFNNFSFCNAGSSSLWRTPKPWRALEVHVGLCAPWSGVQHYALRRFQRLHRVSAFWRHGGWEGVLVGCKDGDVHVREAQRAMESAKMSSVNWTASVAVKRSHAHSVVSSQCSMLRSTILGHMKVSSP